MEKLRDENLRTKNCQTKKCQTKNGTDTDMGYVYFDCVPVYDCVLSLFSLFVFSHVSKDPTAEDTIALKMRPDALALKIRRLPCAEFSARLLRRTGAEIFGAILLLRRTCAEIFGAILLLRRTYST